jgi:peptidoglycan/xylan/chitin deacetylase (PgdA/CDA1 family)
MNVWRFALPIFLGSALPAAVLPALAQSPLKTPVELHQSLAVDGDERVAALTLDACSGAFDRSIVDYLVEHRIPATIFATRKWMRRNAAGMRFLLAHRDLFEIENHGTNHVPAVIGRDRQVYGIAGHRQVAGLVREVLGAAAEIRKQTGVAPHWYRAATGIYDPDAIKILEGMGYRLAGFSLNADEGAHLAAAAVAKRLARATSGDIIIAHVNHPDSDSGQGLVAGLETLERQGYRFVTLGDLPVRTLK